MGKLVIQFDNDPLNKSAEVSKYINDWFLAIAGGSQLLEQALQKGDIQVEIFLFGAKDKIVNGHQAIWLSGERKIVINSLLGAHDFKKVFQLPHAWFKR